MQQQEIICCLCGHEQCEETNCGCPCAGPAATPVESWSDAAVDRLLRDMYITDTPPESWSDAAVDRLLRDIYITDKGDK